MSCNAGASDKAKLARGHYSSRVLAPTGGGKTTISLGGYAKAAPKRQPRKGRGNPAFANQNAGFGQQNMNQGMANMGMGNQGRGMGSQGRGRGGQGRGMGNQSQGIFGGQQQRAGGQKRTGGVRRNVGPQGGAAGGKAAVRDTGGYGSYDVTHASSRVLAQPGGGSSLSFGTSTKAPQRKPGNRRKNQPGGASTAFSNDPVKPKKFGNESQRRAAKSLQSDIFGGPPKAQPKRNNAKSRNAGGGAMSKGPQIKKRSTKNFKQPGGGQSQDFGQNRPTRKISQPTGGKSSNMFQPSTGGRPTPTTRVLASAGGGKSSAFSNSPVPQPRRGVGRVTKATGTGTAGGGRIKHTGGYGNYDINTPSSRVTHQPGGGSTVFGPAQSKPAKTGVRRAQNRPGYGRGAGGSNRLAGGSSAIKNSGGYGNLDIHSKPSTRVHAPPGGKSNMPF